MSGLDLTFTTLRKRYADGTLTPLRLVEELVPLLEREDTHRVWIHKLSADVLRACARETEKLDRTKAPLYGVPFVIKDNIDLAGVPTTAACPAYSYVPKKNAAVVQRLLDAGAIPLGKANLDQFATGLVGVRSPYGACKNSFDPSYVSGGSSSGSAVSVALGMASFSLGSDTAGSGRVPAALNSLIGHKPSCGLISATGTVPACKSLDCISIFALTAEDALSVLDVVAGFDAADPYSRKAKPYGFDFGGAVRFTFGVPKRDQLEFFGNNEFSAAFERALTTLQSLGGTAKEIDLQPFLDAAKLLYEGPWVAERYQGIREFFEAHAEDIYPVTRTIIGNSKRWSAADAYDYQYRLRALKRLTDAIVASVDFIVTPTIGTAYTIEQVESDPIRLNSDFGYYTNFMNLLDYAATAVPSGFVSNGFPFGVTIFADAHNDVPLLHMAARLQRASVQTVGATQIPLPSETAARDATAFVSGQVRVAVCGAHMSGLPLNYQLVSRGARFVRATRTAPNYRLYALPGGPPYRPGMVRVATGGSAIELEVWELPASEFGSFVAGIPAPLGIGTVQLEEGSSVHGFVCEAIAAAGATDISHLGGWRVYLRQLQ